MKRQLIKGAAIIPLFLFTFLTPTSDFVYAQQPVASFFYDDQGHVTQQARDTNGDGKMDRWTHYNERGQIERIEQDMNFDGKPDAFVYYENGKPRRQEVAGNNDGRIDLWYLLDPDGKVEIQIERVSQPCGSTIRTASRYGPKNRTVLPA
jgi:hypothetical protein